MVALLVSSLAGCNGSASPKPSGSTAEPSFTLAWSEYPSWSIFGVAHEMKLIDGAEGKLGPIEKKWGVDIVLKGVDYDTSITMYTSSSCDAVCITNMDVLNPALSRKSVAILPTSTSFGADACVVVGIDSVEQLRGHKVYGLEKSVSEYCFERALQKLGEKESDHQFVNKDPATAAQAMQTNQKDYEAIMVWNPFVLQTLKTRKDSKVLFDSKLIPGEIIDMVVVAQSSLSKPGGDKFASAVVEAFYEVNKLLAESSTQDETILALGAKFSNLQLDDMKTVLKQTLIYDTPDDALELFDSATFKDANQSMVTFCVRHKILSREPTIVYGSGNADAQLQFSPDFIQRAKAKQP